MIVESWAPMKHHAMVSSWMRSRGLGDDMGDPDCYPPTGIVADGCAVGFLFRTDAPRLCWLGSIAADPWVTKERRSAALAAVVESLKAIAAEWGMRTVVTFPGPFPTLVAALQAEGFAGDGLPHSYMQLRLVPGKG